MASIREKEKVYRPGFDMHWIQARKAWEDTENWRPGTMPAIEGCQITVEFADGSTRVYWSMSAPKISDALPAPAFANERWHVLAIGSTNGNVIAVQDEYATGNVFALAGKRRLAFLSIALPGEPRSVRGWRKRLP